MVVLDVIWPIQPYIKNIYSHLEQYIEKVIKKLLKILFQKKKNSQKTMIISITF